MRPTTHTQRPGNRETRNPDTKLPPSLLRELTAASPIPTNIHNNNNSNTPSTPNHATAPSHHKRRAATATSFTTTTRKQARKERRLQKKRHIASAQHQFRLSRKQAHERTRRSASASPSPAPRAGNSSSGGGDGERKGKDMSASPHRTPRRKRAAVAAMTDGIGVRRAAKRTAGTGEDGVDEADMSFPVNGIPASPPTTVAARVVKRRRVDTPSTHPSPIGNIANANANGTPQRNTGGGGGDGNVTPVPDAERREIQRLEKLLGVDKRRKRTRARGGDFSYAGVFGEGGDELADLVNFCDRRSVAGGAASSVGGRRSGGEFPSDGSQDGEEGRRRKGTGRHGQAVYQGVVEESARIDSSQQEEDRLNDGQFDDDDEEGSEEDSEEEDDIPEDDGERDDTALASQKVRNENGDALEVTEDSPTRPLPQVVNTQRTPSSGGEGGESGRSIRDSSVRKASKYVPPSARKRGEPSVDAFRRRVRGLLNRVADVNASGIAENLAVMFRDSSHGLSLRELADMFANAVLDSSRDGSGVGQVNPYVQSHAAIAAHLGQKVDVIILATLLVLNVRRMVSMLERGDAASGHGPHAAPDGEALDEARGDSFGYVAVLCALYTRGAVGSRVLYDMVKNVASNMNGVRLEVLLFMLRQVGAQLRVDDPVGLKDVIEFIYERSASLRESAAAASKVDGESAAHTKVHIMVDLINDIKNNKLKRTAMKEEQVKFSWVSTPGDPLNASILDLLDDDFVAMRWWDDTKGLTVAERRGVKTGEVDGKGGEESGAVNVHEGPDLSTLAHSLRLNTDYRRALFRCIMSSASVGDALDRLESMGAFDSKKGHDRDAALVVLHCCGAEKDFNMFYAVLAERFCRRSRRLRFTFEFAMWDIFKAIPGTGKVPPMSERKRSHFGMLLTHLLQSGAMSVSVLRFVTDFEECGDVDKAFYTGALLELVRKLSKREKDRLEPFAKLATESWNGVGDFRISLSVLLRRSIMPCLSGAEKAVVTSGLDLLEGQG